MNDTVLAGWGELLPLIVFIILGWLANRAKQKKEQELLGDPEQAEPSGQGQPQGGRPVPARRQPHTVDDGEDVEDWTGEAWDGEDAGEWNDRRSGEVRTGQPRPAEDRVERSRPAPLKPDSRKPEAQRQLPSDRPAEKGPLIPAKAKEKAAETGKDLLAKLAKELGLELPPPQPRPAPKPAPAPTQKTPDKPAAQKAPAARAPRTGDGPAHAHVPKSHGLSSDEVRVRATEASRSAARPASIASVAPVAAPIAKPLISASEIADGEAMRKAFVLKTILDKPRSLKPRGSKPA